MEQPLKILLLEDSATDAEIIERLLKKESPAFDFKLAMNEADYLRALEEFEPDIIISDNSLPTYNATEALKIIKQRLLRIPFILVTGTVSEEFAANIIKQGADDYILKDRLTRLPSAIDAALRKHQAEKEKEQAAERLKQSEENLKAIFDNTSEGFILIDAEGIIKAFNDRAKDNVPFKIGEDLKTGRSILDFVEEERKELFNTTVASVMQGETIFYDRSYNNPDGTIRWINFTFNPVRKGKYINGLCITGRDITNSKKAAEELKRSFDEKEILAKRMAVILNTLPANIALLDDKGIIIDVNDAWRTFADENGYAGMQYCIGDNYIDVALLSAGSENDDGMKAAHGIRSLLKKEINNYVFEYPCHSVSEERWFRMIATPLQDKEYAGVVIMHIDISEVRRLEEERQKSKTEEQTKITSAMLNAQQKEREAIGAELHDNVNQILVGTNLLLSMASSKTEDAKELIGMAMNHLQEAINENRKIAHELVGPDFVAIDLAEHIYNLTAVMLTTAGIDVKTYTTEFTESLLSREQKLTVYRIIQEQCTNIIKYAKAKSVTITLNTTGEIFEMVITDDGIGMPNDKKAQGIGMRNIKGRLSVFHGTAGIVTSAGNGFSLEIAMPLLEVRDN